MNVLFNLVFAVNEAHLELSQLPVAILEALFR